MGVDAARLAEVDWDTAILHFVHTLDLLPVRTNCGAIWTAIASGEEVPAAQMLPEPGWVRVWRVGLQPHFATIEGGERDAIRLASSGLGFSRVCDRLADTIGVEGAVLAAGRYLSSWMQDGLIADIA